MPVTAVWDNVYGLDMSVIKKIAITEPLVDVVDGKAVVSNTVPVLNLDLLTCTKEDCDFQSDFLLKCLRNDFCHAFVAYFECAFTQVHKPIAFTTSPFATYTHWKQTVRSFVLFCLLVFFCASRLILCASILICPPVSYFANDSIIIRCSICRSL